VREVVGLFEAEIVGNDTGLKEFLSALLEVKTDLVVILLFLRKDYLRKLKVIFGFGKPLLDNPSVNHKELCLL
jgi:hypothetical protein